MKVTIGSVTVRQAGGVARTAISVQRSLEANLVRDLANIQVAGSRNAKVVQARMPSPSTHSNMGATISRAIASAVRKSC